MQKINQLLLLALSVLFFLALPENGVAGEAIPIPKNKWEFQKLLGTFDRGALQRGFQVYKEVCATCHSLHQLSYRHLMKIGFSAAEVKAIAKGFEVQVVNDEGEKVNRPALSSDRFVSPYANQQAARAANNGAYPPDLSVIVKARLDGANYLKALLLGFKEPPAGFKLFPGMYYNSYFSGHQIAMAPPLKADQVAYADGTKATVEQMVNDVVTFLAWAAEPELEARKRIGIKVLLFLSIFALMMLAVLRRTWARVS